MFRATQQHFLHAEASSLSECISEVLLGEQLAILDAEADNKHDWLLVQTLHDGYRGWLPASALATVPTEFQIPEAMAEAAAWHSITVLRGHIYTLSAVSSAPLAKLSLGSQLVLGKAQHLKDGRIWRQVIWPIEGWISQSLLRPLPTPRQLALEFIGTPYRWGGRSAWGIDCSGLMQILHATYGFALPRDSSPQRQALAEVAQPQAGDLAFFPGHVGLMLSEKELLNATSYHMAVAIDILGEDDYGRRLQQELLGFGRPQVDFCFT